MAIDIANAFEYEPPVLDFIWPGFLAGTVGALVAPGATGKSYFSLEAAMSIACSVSGGDLLDIVPVRSGRVVYMAGEDPTTALLQRIYAIGQHLEPDARKTIAQNLIIEPIMGKRLNIMNDQQLDDMINVCAESRLIVLDTLSRIHQLDENSNGEMAQLISTLEYLANTTGASVLYLHHVNKGSVREGVTAQQQAARGASALVDNVRWCGYIAKMTEQEARRFSANKSSSHPIDEGRGHFIRFGISKQNYDKPMDDRWYRRHEGGVLLPAALYEITKSSNRGGHRDEI